MVGATGWFPGDILDRLTWQDVTDLSDYWADHPPVQWMVQAYLGIKPKEAQSLSVDQLNAFATTGALP